MRTPFLRMFKPWMQLLYVFTFIVIGSMIAEGIIFTLGKLIWGINVYESTALFSNSNDESLLSFRRIDIIISVILIFILPATVFRRLMEFDGQDFLAIRRKINWPKAAMIIIVFIFSFIVCNTLYYYNTLLDPEYINAQSGAAIKQMEKEQLENVYSFLMTDNIKIVFLNLFAFGILTAIGEELIFRSVFLRLIIKMTGKVHVAIFLSAALFSLAHFSYFMFLPRLFMGMVLGYIYVSTANIWYCVLFHFVNNAISVLLPFFIYKGINVHDIDQFGGFGWTVIVGTLFFIGGIVYLVLRNKKIVNERFVNEVLEY